MDFAKKRRTVKSGIAVFAAVVLLLAALPLSVFALPVDSVYLGGVGMGDGSSPTYYKNGDTAAPTGSESDYNAKLEKVGGVLTLTLNGLNVPETAYYAGFNAGIYSKQDLVLVLMNENTVCAPKCGIWAEDKALTVSGSGTLAVSSARQDGGVNQGILAYSVTVSSGTLTAAGGDSTDGASIGIEANTVAITGGTVTARGGNAAQNSVGIMAPSISITGGTVTAQGGTAGSKSYGLSSNNITIRDAVITARGNNKGMSSRPSLGTELWYQYKTAETGPVTKSTTAQIGSAADGPYVHIEPIPVHQNHPLCGDSACTNAVHAVNSSWIAVADQAGLAAMADGNYYLTNDITLSEALPFSGRATLCLNGHKITGSSADGTICLGDSTTFTVCDCAGTGLIENTSSGAAVRTRKKTAGGWSTAGDVVFALYSGTLKGSSGCAYECSDGSSCTFNQYGGTLTTDSGYSAVKVDYGNGKYNLYGGTVTGTGSWAVYVAGGNASMDMDGSPVINGTVWVDKPIFISDALTRPAAPVSIYFKDDNGRKTGTFTSNWNYVMASATVADYFVPAASQYPNNTYKIQKTAAGELEIVRNTAPTATPASTAVPTATPAPTAVPAATPAPTAVPVPAPVPAAPASPKTGDPAVLGLWAALALAGGCSAVGATHALRKNKQETLEEK